MVHPARAVAIAAGSRLRRGGSPAGCERPRRPSPRRGAAAGDRPAADPGRPRGAGPESCRPIREDLPPNIEPLPGPTGRSPFPSCREPTGPPRARARDADPLPRSCPGAQRRHDHEPFTRSGRQLQISADRRRPPTAYEIYIVRGGINIVTRTAKSGTIDIEADEAVIWRGPTARRASRPSGPTARPGSTTAAQPMEVYLEGNVVLRQDENKFAGKGDQRTVRAPRLYYDFLTDRFLAPNAEIDMFAPSLAGAGEDQVAADRAVSPADQVAQRDLRPRRAARDPRRPPTMTGSRFPDPGLQAHQTSIDLTRHTRPADRSHLRASKSTNPGDPRSARGRAGLADRRPAELLLRGPFPVFYWPHIVMDLDDSSRRCA